MIFLTRSRLVYIALVITVSMIWTTSAFFMGASSQTLRGMSYNDHFAHYMDTNQYARLGDALIQGSLSLDLPVPDALAELENPYDFESRYVASNGGENPMYWDHAFYEGKYYCYFGVVPAVLLYVPYQLLTGDWLSTPLAVAVLGIGFIVGASLLVFRISKRYFRDSATTTTTVLALLFVVGGSNVAYLGYVPRFYSVPILASMMFTMLGLWFWIGARRDSGGSLATAVNDRPSESALSLWHLAAGSACMALNFGCRPQFMLACFLAFPIFWREITEERLLFSRKGLKATCAALLPFVVVLAPLLWYNYARFGSVFDFGSNYNLTGFDMPEYHQSWRLTPTLLYFYLLQPFDLSSQFPFVEPTDLTYPIGWAPTEPMFGGYFWLVPVALLVFLLPSVRKFLRQRGLWVQCLFMLAFAAIVLLVDTRTAGVTQRYFSDFGWYLMLVAAYVFFALQAQRKSGEGLGFRRWPLILGCVTIALTVSLLVGGASLFSPDRYDSIAALNPELHATVKGLLG